MKKLYNAVVVGFRTASTSLRMALVLYVFSLVIAVPVALMFHSIMTGALGSSMLTDRLLQGFDATVYTDFIGKGGKALNSLISQVGWLSMAALVLGSVLDGGIMGRLNSLDRPFTLASFLGDCGRFFWRYVRLTLIFVPVLLVVLLASTALFESIYEAVDRNAVSEVDVFRARIVILAATFFLVGLVVLMSDYARVETARSDARSMISTSWAGVKFVLRKFFSVVGLQLAFLIVSVCVIAGYLLAENQMNASTGAGILLLVVLQQLTIFLRMVIRVATFAGERHLYLSTAAGQPDSFPVGLASSLPGLPAVRPAASAIPAPAAHPFPAARPAPSALPVPVAHPRPAAHPAPAPLAGTPAPPVRPSPSKPAPRPARPVRKLKSVPRPRRRSSLQSNIPPRIRRKAKVLGRQASGRTAARKKGRT